MADQTDADESDADVDVTETLIDKGGAKPTYANVSASFDVAVPRLNGSDDDQEQYAAKQLAKALFEDEFGFRPGLRSEVTAESKGRGLPDGYPDIDHNARVTEYRVTIITQEKGL